MLIDATSDPESLLLDVDCHDMAMVQLPYSCNAC